MVKKTVYKNTLLGRIFFAIALFALLFCAGLGVAEVSNRCNQWTQDNGERVVATIVEVITIEVTTSGLRDWSCMYRYVAENGTVYAGSIGKYEHRADAEKRIGEEIEIVIDGKGTSYLATDKPISYTCGIISGCLFIVFIVSVIINRVEKKKYRIAVKNGTWENK